MPDPISIAPSLAPAFVLLDDASAPADMAASRLFTGWLGEHCCADPAELDTVWSAAMADWTQGVHLVLLADYEWGVRLAGLAAPPGALRLLRFAHCERLARDGVDAWLARQEGAQAPAPAGVFGLTPDDDEATYTAAIGEIHARIRAGETYQVNHTQRLRGRSVGTPLALYRRLRAAQPVPFGALIALPQDRWVLSCSPELFVHHHAGRLVTRPMKGTAPRHADLAADQASADWLARDVKNRAENLMIVDLLRNDLGRLATVGSVRVPALFAVEPYRTVFQMTSTIEADLPPATDLPDVLRAVFPCGSITGAPKRQTMSVIGRLESSPRGLYTGAIGWLDAPDAADHAAGRVMGDFCLSVAIRTLDVGAADPCDGTRAVVLGVGGGIVLDSEVASEAAECRHKVRFLTGTDPGFTLFETMRVEGRQVCRFEAHLARLLGSAAALGFTATAAAVQAAVAEAVQAFPTEATQVHRLRIDLSHGGGLVCRSGVLAPWPDGPVRLLAPQGRVPVQDAALLSHKTSLRATYDAAVREAEALGAFDRLFVDARGALTEGGRSTLLVKLDGRWYTPPGSAGVLPGVMRSALMADPVWQVSERVLWPADLDRAEALAVCNALRGVLPAVLVPI
ncbi:bifunctional chorismate-binding protein/class IV aminotransferase [Sphaerotilus sp.]|uniref:bifunctional chorismate-binding protein/class IV aminotransferase n=1 Tax=Sphaerotilus sp. TaxID=2093942 RepID=UPI0034E1EFE4